MAGCDDGGPPPRPRTVTSTGRRRRRRSPAERRRVPSAERPPCRRRRDGNRRRRRRRREWGAAEKARSGCGGTRWPRCSPAVFVPRKEKAGRRRAPAADETMASSAAEPAAVGDGGGCWTTISGCNWTRRATKWDAVPSAV